MHEIAAAEVGSSVRPLRILVVEDDGDLREALADAIESHGHGAVTATNGREGLRQMRACEPDVVVLDLFMPLMDGWQFRLAQKRDPSLAWVPVIAMSASDGAAAATIDSDLYVKKPFTPEQLVKAIGDVSIARRRKQEMVEAAQTERLIALGTLAAGMAHEINNPLTYVFLSLTGAMRRLGQAGRAGTCDRDVVTGLERLLKNAVEGSERIRGIVSGIRLFSRTEAAPLVPVDVRMILDAALRLVMNDLRVRARLLAQYCEVPLVLGDEGRLGQVFLNLLGNAIQAIEEGAPERNQIFVATFTDAHGRAVIEIRDTGVGIPDHLIGRVFEPFFTTKPVGAGTGLGLSISHGIIRSLGGEITVESTVNRGTTFRVSFPRAAPAEPRDDQPAAPALAPAMRPLSILVVDDEPAIGEALRNALSPEHDVVVAASAHQAIERFTAQEPYDLVLCDLQMPGMSGVELYRYTRSVWPAVAQAIVFMTGGTLTPEARAELEADHRRILEKPLDLDYLQLLITMTPRAAPPR